MASIIRLENIVRTGLGLPIGDPSWSLPVSVIWTVLECNIAVLCASIPIFWPMLEERWGAIFVTKEIQITHEDRVFDEEDQFSGRHIRMGSDAELKRSDSGGDHHYNNSYVMQSVDPLRNPVYGDMRVEAVARSVRKRVVGCILVRGGGGGGGRKFVIEM